MKIINIILCPPTDNLAKAKIFKLIIQIMDYESIEASKVLNTFTMKCLNELNLLSVVFKMIKIHRDHEPLLQHGVTIQNARCGESCGIGTQEETAQLIKVGFCHKQEMKRLS